MKRIAIAAAVATAALSAGAAQAEHLNIAVEGATFKGDTITFPSVLMDKPGWLVIHAVENGAPVVPGSEGHVWLPAGESRDVSVDVSGMVMKGADYNAMLHYETNGNESYDFGPGSTDVDTPAMKADGTPYMIMFKTAM